MADHPALLTPSHIATALRRKLGEIYLVPSQSIATAQAESIIDWADHFCNNPEHEYHGTALRRECPQCWEEFKEAVEKG